MRSTLVYLRRSDELFEPWRVHLSRWGWNLHIPVVIVAPLIETARGSKQRMSNASRKNSEHAAPPSSVTRPRRRHHHPEHRPWNEKCRVEMSFLAAAFDYSQHHEGAKIANVVLAEAWTCFPQNCDEIENAPFCRIYDGAGSTNSTHRHNATERRHDPATSRSVLAFLSFSVLPPSDSYETSNRVTRSKSTRKDGRIPEIGLFEDVIDPKWKIFIRGRTANGLLRSHARNRVPLCRAEEMIRRKRFRFKIATSLFIHMPSEDAKSRKKKRSND